jgi:hypothetical protein
LLWYRLITVVDWYDNQTKKNKATILSEEQSNSLRISLLVIINVAKPAAVVRLVIKVAVPTLVITRCNALALFP